MILDKFKNFIALNRKLTPHSVFSYYKLKYVKAGEEKTRDFKLKNGLRIKVLPRAGDLCTLHEIFVKEDYRISREAKGLKILDIGANVGYFSLYASANVPDSRIYSFEPFPESYKMLLKHIELNKKKNIRAYPLAVSTKSGKADFYSIPWAGCNTIIPGKFDEGLYSVTQVDCVSFEKVFEITEVNEFDFAKIDCEGSEYQIFLESKDDTISSVKNYVIEVHQDEKFSISDLVNWFNALGFETEIRENLLHARKKDQ